MISQREARRLRKRVAELEAAERMRRNAWNAEHPGGTHIRSVSFGEGTEAAIRVSMLLGHALVIGGKNSDGSRRIYALPHKESPL